MHVEPAGSSARYVPGTVGRSAQARAPVLANAAPFSSWPAGALARLAHASRVATHRRGEIVRARGAEVAVATLVVDGAVQARVSAPCGRRVTFAIAAAGSLHGLLSLLDGRAAPNDLIAIEPTTTLSIPFAAIRAELKHSPALWQSVARETGHRARRHGEQTKQFLFDPPRVRMAAALLELERVDDRAANGPVVVSVRMPQERLAEMLGVSRQWATSLVREMTQAGLVEWRYGRVTVLNLAGLRSIAEEGINSGA